MSSRVQLAFAIAACILAVAPPALAGPAAAAPPACTRDSCPCESSPSPYSGSKVALVVGTDIYSGYMSDEIPNLQNAVNDARRMASLLAAQGFAVRCLFNPTALQFRAEKNLLTRYLGDQQQRDPDAASEAGVVVVHVAGHGYRDPTDSQDYLLFQYDPDVRKYQKPVNFETVAGRMEMGRWAVQPLTRELGAMPQRVIILLDACRSAVDFLSAAGHPVHGGPMDPDKASLSGHQIIVGYSTELGGFAADSVPNSPEEHNGLYASILSSFLELPLPLAQVFGLTESIVRSIKPDQQPRNLPLNAFSIQIDRLGYEEPGVCTRVDTHIWNAFNLRCHDFGNKACIDRDICPWVQMALGGDKDLDRDHAKACLDRYKVKWLHNDLIGICSGPQLSTAVSFRMPVAAPGGARFQPPPAASITSAPARLAQPVPAPGPGGGPPVTPSGSNAAPPAAPARKQAYNVVVASDPNPSASDVMKLLLSSWASNTESPQIATGRTTDLAAWQASLDQDLARLNGTAQKRAFASRQRDSIIAKSDQGKAPEQPSRPPFTIDLTGQTIAPRNLPARNAAAIDTFTGDNVTAEVDCSTLPCVNDWIGVRVKQGNTVHRGWLSAEALKSVVKPGVTITVEYDGQRLAPKPASLDAIRQAIRPDQSKPPAVGRIHIAATRRASDDSQFNAGARLSFLNRVVTILGVNPDEVDLTVINVPNGSSLPSAIINVGPPASK